MDATLLIYPMAALALITFLVLLSLPALRVVAVRNNKVSARFYRLMRGATEPELPAALSNNYKNLLELPVLFYVICILLIVLNRVEIEQVVLAWCYVGLRLLHTLVHISYNQVLHRLAIFSASSVVLAVMWLRLLITPG